MKFRTGTLPPLLTVNSGEWVLKQVVELEDNREIVKDQALKHKDNRDQIFQSNMLVKNMETISVEWTTSLLPKQNIAVF